MIMAQEQALLKGREQFDRLLDLVRSAAQQDQRIDAVGRDLMRELLSLGHTLLGRFIAQRGDGDLGPTVPTAEGRTRHRLPSKHDRRDVSTFGELTIPRIVYGSREGQKIERAPRDERLGRPEDCFSDVREDWPQRLGLKESFAEAGGSLEARPGLRLGLRPMEPMDQSLDAFATAFRASVGPPPAEEEGPLLVVTADGKGMPMRRPPGGGPKPHHRRTKGEKANQKQRACVGAVYRIEPFVRTADDLLDEVRRHKKAEDRPRPRHKHVGTSMVSR